MSSTYTFRGKWRVKMILQNLCFRLISSLSERYFVATKGSGLPHALQSEPPPPSTKPPRPEPGHSHKRQVRGADICVAIMCQFLEPLPADKVHIPKEAQIFFGYSELAAQFPELIKWRDELVAKHWVEL